MSESKHPLAVAVVHNREIQRRGNEKRWATIAALRAYADSGASLRRDTASEAAEFLEQHEAWEETNAQNSAKVEAFPQMLEALRALVEAHSKIVEGPDLEDEDCHRARAAIAAATGGEQ